MWPRNATARILQCLVLWCALSAVGVQGRSLQIRKRHGGRARSLVDLENERDFEPELDNAEDFVLSPVRHSKRRHSRNRESAMIVASGSEEELRNPGSSDDEPADFRKLAPFGRRSHAINKRHNGAFDEPAYETMSEIDEITLRKSRARHFKHPNNRYEVEIKEAQNSSLCNYTIVDVPDTSIDNSRVPKNLVHVICSHAGSTCRENGNYCCIQTYTKIDVAYGNGERDVLKILTGCVCSRRFYGVLNQYKPRLAIDD